jgi:hypothetical protein
MYDDNGRPLAFDPSGKVIALQMAPQQQQQSAFVQGLPQQLPPGFRPYLDQQGNQIYDNVGQPLAINSNGQVVSLQFQQVQIVPIIDLYFTIRDTLKELLIVAFGIESILLHSDIYL